LLAALVGLPTVAAYRTAAVPVFALAGLLMPLGGTLLVALNTMERDAARAFAGRVMGSMLAVTLPCAAALCALAPELLTVFGSEYGRSVGMLQGLSLLVVERLANRVLRSANVHAGRHARLVAAHAVGLLATVVLGVFLAGRSGANGMVGAVLLARGLALACLWQGAGVAGAAVGRVFLAAGLLLPNILPAVMDAALPPRLVVLLGSIWAFHSVVRRMRGAGRL
jgi:O-antigen/teichoic acid export membrane protein